MAPIIAFLIAIGVIFSADEATQELIDEYQPVYEQQQEDIIGHDLYEM